MKDSLIRAAGFYLCDEDLEEAVKKLEKGQDDVILWEPFENWEPAKVYEVIIKLAEDFEELKNGKDKIVNEVREDLLRRSKRGIEKYGVTLDREDLTLRDWLQHAYEETLDNANYLKKAIIMLDEGRLCTKGCIEGDSVRE